MTADQGKFQTPPPTDLSASDQASLGVVRPESKHGLYFETIILSGESVSIGHIRSISFSHTRGQARNKIWLIEILGPTDDEITARIKGGDLVVPWYAARDQGIKTTAYRINPSIASVKIGKYLIQPEFVTTPQGTGLLLKTQSPDRIRRPKILKKRLEDLRSAAQTVIASDEARKKMSAAPQTPLVE